MVQMKQIQYFTEEMHRKFTLTWQEEELMCSLHQLKTPSV